jgi:REP element-mobilizing transposase RayT
VLATGAACGVDNPIIPACETGERGNMSHTHLLYHIVFATKDRMPIINPEWQHELHKYLGGIVKNFEDVPIEINGIEDHVHLLVRLKAHIQYLVSCRN